MLPPPLSERCILASPNVVGFDMAAYTTSELDAAIASEMRPTPVPWPKAGSRFQVVPPSVDL